MRQLEIKEPRLLEKHKEVRSQVMRSSCRKKQLNKKTEWLDVGDGETREKRTKAIQKAERLNVGSDRQLWKKDQDYQNIWRGQKLGQLQKKQPKENIEILMFG